MDSTPRKRIVATYDYRDELDHHVVFQKVRLEPKEFAYRYRLNTWEEITRARRPETVRTPEGQELFDWGKPLGADRYLYRLPFVQVRMETGGDIWWTEGEKDADAIVAHSGECATSHHGGALEVYTEQCRWLKGARRVILVVDRDNVGALDGMIRYNGVRSHVDEVVMVCAREGKDAYDHFAAGYRIEDFKQVTVESVKRAALKYRPKTAAERAGYRSQLGDSFRKEADRWRDQPKFDWKPKKVNK